MRAVKKNCIAKLECDGIVIEVLPQVGSLLVSSPTLTASSSSTYSAAGDDHVATYSPQPPPSSYDIPQDMDDLQRALDSIRDQYSID